MTGIAELFAELDGYDRYELALAVESSALAERRRIWQASPQAKAKAVQRVRLWRKANPKHAAELNKRNRKAWVQRNPERAREIKRARMARWRAANLEHVRERDRRNTAAYRARKAAAS
jgi:hypothetical protein